MTEREVLRAIELPLATPLILDGVRTAAVQVVATATLGAYAGWGGLGAFIRDGFAVRAFDSEVPAGALLVAAFALATEGVFGLLTRWLSPKTASQGRKPPRAGFETGEEGPIQTIRAA